MDWETLKKCFDSVDDGYSVTFYHCDNKSNLPFIDITIDKKEYDRIFDKLKKYKHYRKIEQFYDYKNTSMILSKDKSKKWFRKMTYGDIILDDNGTYIPWLSEKLSEDQFPILSNYDSSGTRDSIMYHIEKITLKLVKSTDEKDDHKCNYFQIDFKGIDDKTKEEWSKLQKILDY